MNSATADSIRIIIAEYCRVQPNRIVNHAKFRDLGADWLELIELFMVIEDQLPDLRTDKLVVEQIETVGDLLLALVDLSEHTAQRGRRSAA